MLSTDVVVAGGGISGLLIASALATRCEVTLLEQSEYIPQNKFWVTTEQVVEENSRFNSCINRRYAFMDFVAYDGTTARVPGRYCLWDSAKLIDLLVSDLRGHNVSILTGHRLYSVSARPSEIIIKANAEAIHAKLLVDCMGFGSPLVGANDIADITGYYVVHGREVIMTGDLPPIALDNVIINKVPAYFELFPTSQNTAHAAIVLPARHHKPDISLARELKFILEQSHYSSSVKLPDHAASPNYHGIIPVGRLLKTAINRVVFFGESGQTNPAASATAFTRMLSSYQATAEGLWNCLKKGTLDKKHLTDAMPDTMTRMNRIFQETLFESLLSFTSNDFRRLVEDMRDYPASITSDLIFADYKFNVTNTARLALDVLLRPQGVMGRHIIKSLLKYCGFGR